MTRTRISTTPWLALGLGLLLMVSLGPAPTKGQSGGDRLVVAQGSDLYEASLPRGGFEVVSVIQDPPDAIAFGPDGRLFAVGVHFPVITAPPFIALYTIGAQGETTIVSNVEIQFFETILDMAFGPGGELFVLVYGIGIGDPPTPAKILYQLDPETGDTVNFFFVPAEVEAVASSPRGLWLLGYDHLLHFDPAIGRERDSGLAFGSFGAITSAATDSTGALWFITRPGNIDPVPSILRRFDPPTGSSQVRDHFFEPYGPLAIEWRCQPSESERCLLGGRFRARVEWLDFDDRMGDGQVAPSGSADSALFWFFEPSNWELLVKVIDGCDENGHFWVFSAGTTNVEHTLQVEDLLTGEIFSTTNPLGQASAAITATDAFAGCDP